MTWARQVIHVIRKDARITHWFTLALVAITAAMTWLVVEDKVKVYDQWILIVGPTAMTGICLIVQSDSPSDPQAYWVTKPLDSMAIACAKIVNVVFIVVLLRATGFAVVAVTTPTANSLSAALAEHYDILTPMQAGAAVIAALTPDLRAFFATVIFALIASFVIAWSLYALTFVDGTYPQGLSVIMTGGAVPVLLYTYKTRSVARGAIAALTVIAFQLITVALVATS